MANNVLQSLNEGIDASNKLTDTSRKAEAYNALKQSYGDIAGDPERALELQSYGARQNAIPVEQQQRELNLKTSRDVAPLNQRKLVAQTGLEEENTADKADAAQATAIERSAQFIQAGIDRGEDPVAKFDQVTPLLRLPPEKVTAIRAAIQQNPGVVKDLLNTFAAKAKAGPPDPSNVREYQFWGKLTPEQQAQYLDVKRASNVGFGEVGGVRTATRVTPTGQITSTPLGTLAGEANAASTIAGAKQVGEAAGKITAEDLPQSQVSNVKAQQQADATKQSFDVADKAIEDATKDTGWLSAGPLSHLPDFANPNAATLRGDLNTIQSKVVLDTITEMKSLSKTGSTGFGQLSDREGQLISSRLGAVLQASTPKRLKQSLTDLQGQLKISRDRVLGAYEAEQKLRAPKAKAPAGPDTSGRVEGNNVILKWNAEKGELE